jgi:DNA-binding transcriptional LysR family regulator
MAPLQHLEAFVQSVDGGSFSAAARRLGVTPAAVSKNVARLESTLGVRLFQRSTRRLTLTEAGVRFHAQVGGPLAALQEVVAGVDKDSGEPAGMLKVSMGQAFGRTYLVPLLGEFLRRHPAVVPDWHFENRQVDLVGEAFDAAIGGGFRLAPGVVARELGRVHIVATAAPSYLRQRPLPRRPVDLAGWDGIVRRSSPTGRVRPRMLRNAKGDEAAVECTPRLIFTDPEAMAQAALMGLGVALLPMPFALPWLEQGALVRLLPGWYEDAGPLSIYYPSRKLVPPKTRVFVDFVLASFKEAAFAGRMDAR